jgi:hypothetical protein
MIRSRVGLPDDTPGRAHVIDLLCCDGRRGAVWRQGAPVRRLHPPDRDTRRLDQRKPLITLGACTLPLARPKGEPFDRSKLLIGLVKALLVHPRRHSAEKQTRQPRGRFQPDTYFLRCRRTLLRVFPMALEPRLCGYASTPNRGDSWPE